MAHVETGRLGATVPAPANHERPYGIAQIVLHWTVVLLVIEITRQAARSCACTPTARSAAPRTRSI
jgi:cytochrome b561